jgi:molecular chaperone IbpA
MNMTFDFAPLYRTTVGFDHLASLLDSITTADRTQSAFPPYNIELLAQDKYRITMAVAGFAEEDIRIESENNTLTVSANRTEKAGETKRSYLHQGIAERNFRRQFRLADHVKVVSAALTNGLLHVDLEREVPEAMKPRTIAINGRNVQPLLKSA